MTGHFLFNDSEQKYCFTVCRARYALPALLIHKSELGWKKRSLPDGLCRITGLCKVVEQEHSSELCFIFWPEKPGVDNEVAQSSCKLLLIDSDSADAELAGRLINQSFPDCTLITVSDAVAFAEQMAIGGFSVAVSEQTLGWASGMEVLTRLSNRYPGIRTMLFTASDLPKDCSPLQHERLFAYVQKNNAGFLRLVNTLGVLLKRDQQSGDEPESDPWRRPGSGGKGQGTTAPKADMVAGEPDDKQAWKLLLLRRQAAEVLRSWKIAGKQRGIGLAVDQETVAPDEDFRLVWDEKSELYALEIQQAWLNSAYLGITPGHTVESDVFLLQTQQINNKKNQIRIKYKNLRERNRSKRRYDNIGIPGD
ncbi:hypothetical protein [Thiolapillus sp.]